MVTECIANALLDEWERLSATSPRARIPRPTPPIARAALDRLADDGCPLHGDEYADRQMAEAGNATD